MKFKIFLIIVLLTFTFGCSKQYKFEDGKIVGIQTIQDLNKASVFTFGIMSDNKGDSPQNSEQFARMVKWLEKSSAQFVIGLGDHVKKGWENSFLEFLKQNQWWKNHFYPNIADGENEYYGKSQSDWGAGAPLLDVVNLSEKSNVKIRKNGCEYYAKIPAKGYTIHLIQLHYPDSPPIDSIAFRENSKEYMMKTLTSINKGDKDIIIVAAHSRTGSWVQMLSDEQKKMVLEKADLILSATTHFCERFEYEGYKDIGALCINTGSITYPTYWCPFGYVQVNVLKKPLALVVQYINAGKNEIEFQNTDYAFIKIVNGEILKTDFRPKRYEEDVDRIIGVSEKDYSKEEMNRILKELYLNATGADEAFARAYNGLPKGDVKYRELWNICPYNDEIYSITFTDEQVKSLFKNQIPLKDRKEIEIAMDSYHGKNYIHKLRLDESNYKKTGKHEVQILEEWIIHH